MSVKLKPLAAHLRVSIPGLCIDLHRKEEAEKILPQKGKFIFVVKGKIKHLSLLDKQVSGSFEMGSSS